MAIAPNGQYGYYLYCYSDLTDPSAAKSGVDKKIIAQIKALNKWGLGCRFKFCPAPISFISKALSCLPLFPDGIHWPIEDELGSPSYLYIRRPALVSRELIKFLRFFKMNHPNSQVLYEIPSYPYDGEMRGFLSFALLKDKKYRKQLSSYVDYIVDLSGAQEIFSIPTIPIINGIDLDSCKVKAPVKNLEKINIISVAFFEPWHGMDRFMIGMKRYFSAGGTRDIHLHLVGEGSELPKLKSLCNELNLNDNITFYGFMESTEIDSIYNTCSLAIECLGIHRKGLGQISSSLKSREYLAKGIPFIGSTNVDVFIKEPVDFFWQAPEDDSPLDMKDIVQFHDSLYSNYSQHQIINEIRKYAQRHISMESAIRNVIQVLKSPNITK